MQGTRISFSSKEAAVTFAEKQGKGFLRLFTATTDQLMVLNPKAGTIISRPRQSSESRQRTMRKTMSTSLIHCGSQGQSSVFAERIDLYCKYDKGAERARRYPTSSPSLLSTKRPDRPSLKRNSLKHLRVKEAQRLTV